MKELPDVNKMGNVRITPDNMYVELHLTTPHRNVYAAPLERIVVGAVQFVDHRSGHEMFMRIEVGNPTGELPPPEPQHQLNNYPPELIINLVERHLREFGYSLTCDSTPGLLQYFCRAQLYRLDPSSNSAVPYDHYRSYGRTHRSQVFLEKVQIDYSAKTDSIWPIHRGESWHVINPSGDKLFDLLEQYAEKYDVPIRVEKARPTDWPAYYSYGKLNESDGRVEYTAMIGERHREFVFSPFTGYYGHLNTQSEMWPNLTAQIELLNTYLKETGEVEPWTIQPGAGIWTSVLVGNIRFDNLARTKLQRAERGSAALREAIKPPQYDELVNCLDQCNSAKVIALLEGVLTPEPASKPARPEEVEASPLEYSGNLPPRSDVTVTGFLQGLFKPKDQ